ncbi:MAG: FAD-binding oxidoreductase [Candidatus Thorarchaeota archaeon]|jgi:FAD/FMN-containing dehydrogenase
MKHAIQDIEDIVGADNISLTPETRALYAKDIASLPNIANQIVRDKFEMVIQPITVKSLMDLVGYANDKGIKLVPRGSGTSGWGGILPSSKSICISMIHMSRILHVDEYSLITTVDAGITWRELLMFLEQIGLTLPVYPSSAAAATVGGFVASGGYGIGSAKHGDIRTQVAGIEVILPNGYLARIGDVVLKSEDDLIELADRGEKWLSRMIQSAQLDDDIEPLDLFMSTYGTFGIITKVTLKVIPKLMHRSFAATFNCIEDLVDAATEILDMNTPYHLRYLTDSYSSKVGSLRRRPDEHGKFILSGSLLGTVYDLEDEVEEIVRIVNEKKGILLDETRAQHHWNERLYPLRIKSLGPSLVPAEALLPLSNVPDMFKNTIGTIGSSGVAIEGTISNEKMASFLVWILDDERKGISYTLGWHRSFDIAKLAKNHSGKPYAVALWNVPHADDFYSQQKLEDLRKIKKAIDPKNLMNPVKVFGGKIKVGKESQLFGFTVGYIIAFLTQLIGPSLIGLSWLHNILWISPSLLGFLPLSVLVAIIGGITGLFFVRMLTLSQAIRLGIPILRVLRSLLRH